MEVLRQNFEKVDGRTSLVFSVRGPIPIQLDESMSNWTSGASVLDLIFPQPETVSEIRFRNWYTARFSLLVRFDDSVQSAPKREHLAWAAAASLSLARLRGVDTTEGIKIGRNLTANGRSLSDWVVSLQNKILMPDPHYETGSLSFLTKGTTHIKYGNKLPNTQRSFKQLEKGRRKFHLVVHYFCDCAPRRSQDIIVISASESLVPLCNITALRFLLRQPSPNWKTFNVEDITVFRDPILLKAKSDSGNGSSTIASSPTSSKSCMRLSGGNGTINSFRLADEKDGETVLDILSRQTANALRPKVVDHMADDHTTETLPTTYDITTLQFN